MSNGPGGKKWLATKVIRDFNEPDRFWSIPFDASPQKAVRIQLSKENILRLEDLNQTKEQ